MSLRLHARLLASGAQNAASIGNAQQASAMLGASEALLDQMPGPNEEFDRAAWLETTAVCALHLGQVDTAIHRFQEALDALPVTWVARRLFATIGLAGALAERREREAMLMTVQPVISSLKAMQAQELTHHFVGSLRQLQSCFPNDREFQDFVDESARCLAVPA